jgi:hypothetical protein
MDALIEMGYVVDETKGTDIPVYKELSGLGGTCTATLSRAVTIAGEGVPC